MGIIETAEYDVELTIRVSTRVLFSDIERDRPIMRSDAVDNAIGLFESGTHNTMVDFFEDHGFSVALPIDGTATVVHQETVRGGTFETDDPGKTLDTGALRG